MMFRHGVGFVPRLMRGWRWPPAHEVVLFAAGHLMLGTASGHGKVIAATPACHVPQPGEMPDTSSAPDGTLRPAYLGESGLGWSGGVTIQNGCLRTSAANLYNIALRDQPLPLTSSSKAAS